MPGGGRAVNGYPEPGESREFRRTLISSRIGTRYFRPNFGDRRVSRDRIGVRLSSTWCLAFNSERPAVLESIFTVRNNESRRAEMSPLGQTPTSHLSEVAPARSTLAKFRKENGLPVKTPQAPRKWGPQLPGGDFSSSRVETLSKNGGSDSQKLARFDRAGV